MAASTAVHRLRAHRLLRQFAEPARTQYTSHGQWSPDYREFRARARIGFTISALRKDVRAAAAAPAAPFASDRSARAGPTRKPFHATGRATAALRRYFAMSCGGTCGSEFPFALLDRASRISLDRERRIGLYHASAADAVAAMESQPHARMPSDAVTAYPGQFDVVRLSHDRRFGTWLRILRAQSQLR